MSQSEKKESTPSFSAYVMLSEAIRFNTSEIEAAVREDFPALDISDGFGMEMDCYTDEFITTPLFMSAKGDDGGVPLLIRLPGYGTWDATQVATRKRIYVPDLEARLARNKSYICVSVGAKSNELVDCFRAARLCSCVASVFAELSVAEVVYWESADQFLTPEDAVKMARESMSDDWPVRQWVGLDPARDEGCNESGGLTVGLRHFTGFEISHAAAPVPLPEALSMLMTMSHMALTYGRSFSDGDTLGHEGQSPEESYRIRHVPAGTQGAPCDVKLIVHPKSTADHEAVAGPILSKPAPPGVDAVRRPREGFFKRLVRGQRAH